MQRKQFLIFTIMLLIILAGAITGITLSTKMIVSRDREIERLNNRMDSIEKALIKKSSQLEKATFKLTGANQQIEQYYIELEADRLTMEYQKAQILHLSSYLLVVNTLMEAAGIEIPRYIYGYIENGKVVK
jgi:chromosome segregation ATPase